MDTKKIQSQGQKKSKGGRNVTQTVLAGAGGVVAGAAGAAAILTPVDEQPDDDPTPQESEVTQEQEEVVNENTQDTETAQDTPVQFAENITEPQPTVGGETHPAPSESATSDSTPTPAPEPAPASDPTPTSDPTINEIAEQIIQDSRIDDLDNDIPTVIAVDGFDVAYNEYGDEVVVAIVHTPDGGQFLLADTNGDGIFSDFYDMGGNYISMTEANLVAMNAANIVYSDLETMFDTSGGYLALNEYDSVTGSDDPTHDIIDTEAGEIDEILAALIDDDPTRNDILIDDVIQKNIEPEPEPDPEPDPEPEPAPESYQEDYDGDDYDA